MEFSGAELIASFLVGSVATALFLYGKKQLRIPQLTGGMAMMVLPFLVGGAVWIYAIGAAIGLAIWASVRAGL